MTIHMRGGRPFVDCQRELEGIRAGWPSDDSPRDTNRGEQRLAAEVALARLGGGNVPERALVRGFSLLETLAFR